MTLHPQAKAFLDQLAEAGARPIEELTPEQNRADHAASSARRNGPSEPVASVTDTVAAANGVEVPVRVITPEVGGTEAPPLIVYLHGGGWVVGTLDTYEPLTRALANRTGAIVVSVDYRLAPEHPWPAALEDAEAATAWAYRQAAGLGADQARVGVAGDSAGGGLAAAVTQRAKYGGPRLAFQTLVYPVLDPALDTPSAVENAEGYYLTTAGMRWYWEQYLGGGADVNDPAVSPGRAADLGGLPPALVITAEYDPLRDEGETYARRLREAGVPTELRRFEGGVHGFFRFRAVMGEQADEAMAVIGDFVRSTQRVTV
jgi:acetyl esterase